MYRPKGYKNPYPGARLIDGSYLGSDLDKHNVFEAGANEMLEGLQPYFKKVLRMCKAAGFLIDLEE